MKAGQILQEKSILMDIEKLSRILNNRERIQGKKEILERIQSIEQRDGIVLKRARNRLDHIYIIDHVYK